MLLQQYSESRALVVGINQYRHAPPLGYAVNDATAVAGTLRDTFGFHADNVHLLLESDATRQGIRERYLAFARDGTQPDDRLVVFFAGHGHTERSSRGDVGFLVPYDGDIHYLATLVRWDELTSNAELIAAKHVLFIMDACYGGLALTRGLTPGGKRFLKDMLVRRSRQVLTAGKADQVVADSGGPLPDHSVFTGHLLEALRGRAANPEGVITATSLSAYVYNAVSTDAGSQQTPHYGQIHGDGDLIFTDSVLVMSGPTESDPLIPEIDTLITTPIVEAASEAEPVTIAEQTKEYLSEERFKIKLHELVGKEIRRVLAITGDDYFPPSGLWSHDEFVKRLNSYETAVADLLPIQALIGFWGERWHRQILILSCSRMGQRIGLAGGNLGLIQLRWYPILLLFYTGGIAAVASKKYENLRDLMLCEFPANQADNDGDNRLVHVVGHGTDLLNSFKAIPGHERQYTPRSEYLLKFLQPMLESALFLGTDYEAFFDEFEVLFALQHAYFLKQRAKRIWGPVGRFGWKHGGTSPMSMLVREAKAQGNAWGPVSAGLFGGSIDEFNTIATEYSELLGKLPWY